jgi:hypothetical protein
MQDAKIQKIQKTLRHILILSSYIIIELFLLNFNNIMLAAMQVGL